ncbi:Inducer of phenazine A [Micromonospora tarensis]|uniref:Inducer of phenazine A n=1 Tax=Micromonospora tarensis TaxID=2806100 RepID=A0ABS1YCD8_9ACTN|nr:Inducer of phenazine A [Micromonospora tarensis]MBM0274964.1 Inducer of phenazine A [Micromonospora tarensis]
MLKYAERFDDRAEIRWMPYLMYFHPTDHRSSVVNTDRLGFRIAEGPGARASAGGNVPDGPVNVIAGSSTVFGIGASNDGATLASRLWHLQGADRPWLNFGGRSHNSTQELLLFTLYRHLLPRIDRIVLLSGFNDLGLARLPRWMQGDDGAFFNCHEYYEQIDQLKIRQRREAGASRREANRVTDRSAADLAVPDLDTQIADAVERTVRHLDTWRLLAAGLGAKLTYVLQPLAPWVREKPAPEEELIFGELDQLANFGKAYGDISRMDVGRRYADELAQGCQKLGVQMFDLSPLLADATAADEWLFVDRIHFTDHGHDVVARLLDANL